MVTIRKHLFWISSIGINALDLSTWVETTRELRNLGWQVSLILAGPKEQRCVQGVDINCVNRPEVYLLRQIVFHMNIIQLLLKEWSGIDIILFHPTAAPWILPFRIIPFLTGQKRPLFVMDSRTLPMELKNRAMIKDKIRAIYQTVINWLVNKMEIKQTAITSRLAEVLQIPARQLLGTWPSGVKIEQFAQARQMRRWPDEGEPVLLIYIGIMQYERNLMSFCEAIETVNAQGLNFKFIMIGEGTEKADLMKFAEKTNDRIKVLSFMPHEEIPQYLSLAHIGVLPFPDLVQFRVSSPIKLFEYMGSGLAILATHIVCHTDVVEKGSFVFWAEDATVEGFVECLKRVWNNKHEIRKMADEAYFAAQEWTWLNSARKLDAALNCRL